MKEKIIWILCVFIFFGLIIPISIGFNRDYQVYTKGKLITVTVTYVPKLLRTRSSGFMKFDYNGKQYQITVRGYNASSTFHTGDSIQLIYLKGYEDNFLLSNNNPRPSGIILILMLLVGGFGSIYYLFKKK